MYIGDEIDTRGTGNFSDSESDKKQTENPTQVPLETPVSTVGVNSQTGTCIMLDHLL